MANHVLTNAHILLNAIDQSAFIQSISFPLEAASVENTAMGG